VATRPWFLSFTFAVACCVIVSGCLAERTRLLVYPAYTGEQQSHRHIESYAGASLAPLHADLTQTMPRHCIRIHFACG
jgi:hypothetical protein